MEARSWAVVKGLKEGEGMGAGQGREGGEIVVETGAGGRRLEEESFRGGLDAERGGNWRGSGGSGKGGGQLRLPAGAVGFKGERRAISNQELGEEAIFLVIFPHFFHFCKIYLLSAVFFFFW